MQNPSKAKPLFEIRLQISLENHGEVNDYIIIQYVYENIDNTIAISYAEKAVYLLEQLLEKGETEIHPHALILPYMNLTSY